MTRVFSIVHEPASYYVERDRAVFDKIGVKYCYMNSISEAKSELLKADSALLDLPFKGLISRIRMILRQHDVFLVSGYIGKVFYIVFLMNLWYKKPIGMDSDTQLRIPSNPIKRFIKWAWLSTVFRNRNYYGLAGGSGSHRELFRHYGMNEKRICLMPMVVNNQRFENGKAQKENGRFRFLYVGRIIDVKNLSTLLEAFVKTFSGREDVELRVVGKGEMLETYRNKYGEYENIAFVGPRYGDDLVEEYHSASAFILPSSYEPWGLVVNEAMAAGLPVIVSDQVGAAHDLVEGRDTGFIFPYNDADALGKQMLRFVDDPDLYHRYSKNAAKLMKEYWNYDLYTECLKDFIAKASSEK